MEDLYKQGIVIKQVIAGQPITRGGSKCTFSCDTENHHIHTYCKVCQRNLPYGTTIHNCKFGLGLGQIHPDMQPEYLINEPWWQESEAVQRENSYYQQTSSTSFFTPYFENPLSRTLFY